MTPEPKLCPTLCFHREDCLRPLSDLGPDLVRPGKRVWLVECVRCGFKDSYRDHDFDIMHAIDQVVNAGGRWTFDLCEPGCCHECEKPECVRCHPPEALL